MLMSKLPLGVILAMDAVFILLLGALPKMLEFSLPSTYYNCNAYVLSHSPVSLFLKAAKALIAVPSITYVGRKVHRFTSKNFNAQHKAANVDVKSIRQKLLVACF